MGRPKKREPGAALSHTCFPLLRDRLETSNFVLLKIPVEIHNLGRGEKLNCIDAERLPEVLGVTERDVESVSQTGLVVAGHRNPGPNHTSTMSLSKW